ncbi:MAG: glycosyltransferase [Desulfovermiculus sp.]|nr:glycosyltransferase [Desulfovermiculus sp.]
MPVISVLLPCHNCAKTLPAALDSLLEQTFADHEILAVNNGSTDQTAQILHSYARSDSRLRVLDIKQAGIVPALNYGLEQAKGRYIARMDADDISLPTRFQEQTDYLENHPHVGLVGGLVVHRDGPGSSPGRAAYVQWINSLITPRGCAIHRFVECPLAHPTFMFRRDIPFRLGGYQQGSFSEDYELILRWAENGISTAKVPTPILIWRDHPNRLSRRDPRCSVAAMYELKSPFLARWLQDNNPHHPCVVILGAGQESRKRSAWLEDEGIQIIAFADISPGRIGQKIQGKRVISIQDLPPPGKCFCVSYVGQRGMRTQVSAFMQNRGYVLGRDFLLAA